MKISNIKVIITCPGRNYVLVKVETDEGIYGVGDATLNGRELAVAKALEEHIVPLLIGKDPDQIEDIWQYIFRGTYWRGGPVLMTALAGIDMALWDIKGKRAGLPLYSLLGGKSRNKALCYTHIAGKDFAEVRDNALKYIEKGYKALRIQVAIPGCKGTYGVSEDNANSLPFVEEWEPGPYLRTIPKLFEYLRVELGDELELLHDVHERLAPIEAKILAKQLEPYRLFFLEDPLRPEHKDSFRVLRQDCAIPIAMGELFSSKWECVSLFENQLIDFIRCDISHIGGISEAKKIANLAEIYYIRTAWHGPSDISPIAHMASVHLDLAVTNFGIQETCEFLPEAYEVFTDFPIFEDGYLTVSEKPGLGCDFNEKTAKAFPYKRGYLPVARRKDGSVQDW
ncbi:MAG: mannonate dehydratase [Candidatus Atribacteria bacterium]|nr:mannonate dehydratase [Candidatus Atribacteria bacterium]